MLYTIAIILIVLWVLGFVTSYTLGGVIDYEKMKSGEKEGKFVSPSN